MLPVHFGPTNSSLFQAPREKRAGEDEGTKTRGTGGEKKAVELYGKFLILSRIEFRNVQLYMTGIFSFVFGDNGV